MPFVRWRALAERSWLSARGAGVLVAVIWGGVFLLLVQRPVATLADAHGLYALEGQARSSHWTSSRTIIPLAWHSGAVALTLDLASGAWADRPSPLITLSADDIPLARFSSSDQPRRYHLLVPAATNTLLLAMPVGQPSPADSRWLGVQIFELVARDLASSTSAALQALIVALFSIPLTLLFRWCVARQCGSILILTTLGLLFRVAALDRLPAGFFQDEAVSLADAWSMLRTGRDHLGNVLPIGAFESFGDWVSPLMTYLQIPMVALLGTAPLAGRLVVALAGTLVIPAIYASARLLRLPGAGALGAALVAAVSPWQIIRSRVAGPPSMALLPWTLCLLTALLLLRQRGRREALLLALTAGIGIYAYPTMKLAVPLLILITLVLALAQEAANGRLACGDRAQPPALLMRWRQTAGECVHAWWPAAVLLGVLWLPLVQLTLLNEYSGMRLSHKLIQADSGVAWVIAWVASYAIYFQPGFYFISGDGSNGIPDQGVQLLAEAPLLLIGLVMLVRQCARVHTAAMRDQAVGEVRKTDRSMHQAGRQLLFAALLIAPLPASLTTPNPHLSRALIIAPVYALLVGIGLATLFDTARRWAPVRWQALLPGLLAAVVMAPIVWQGAARYQDYWVNYPRVVSRKYQDGLREATVLAVAYAPQFDEVWFDGRLSFPYVYVLTAQAMSPAASQALIIVQRPRTTFNTVTQIGIYHFVSLKTLPADLPVIEAIPTSLGEPAYLLQSWHQHGRRILIVRKL